MIRFAYHEPASLAEAVQLLGRYQGSASVLAGGTDLLVEIKEHLRRAAHVVNIKRIPGMRELAFDSGGLKIGALVTAREIEVSPVIQKHYAGLLQAVRELGSIQVRNRATIVGNICRASPSADTLPPLIADGAVLKTSERTIALETFFTGPGRTLLKPDEIVTAVELPAPPPRTGKVYIKHGRRKAMELATVGVAVSVTPGQECRIVLGAVAPTPLRAKAAEAAFLKNGDMEEAAQAAMDEARPISNVRATADYRREMVKVLTRRALELAVERSK
ncbi:MAG: FAD binding domain-containing protein [Betaproteobacteria bacterium]